VLLPVPSYPVLVALILPLLHPLRHPLLHVRVHHLCKGKVLCTYIFSAVNGTHCLESRLGQEGILVEVTSA
jgi:hypothetical protein